MPTSRGHNFKTQMNELRITVHSSLTSFADRLTSLEGRMSRRTIQFIEGSVS